VIRLPWVALAAHAAEVWRAERVNGREAGEGMVELYLDPFTRWELTQEAQALGMDLEGYVNALLAHGLGRGPHPRDLAGTVTGPSSSAPCHALQ